MPKTKRSKSENLQKVLQSEPVLEPVFKPAFKPAFKPMLALSIQYADPTFKALVLRSTLRRWVRAALTQNAELTLRFVDQSEGLQLNQSYRNKNYATNVLTFDYRSTPQVQADLVFCCPVIEAEAQAQGKLLQHHLAHLIVHGVLHAQGFDHIFEEEAQRMEALEIKILARLKIPNPYE